MNDAPTKEQLLRAEYPYIATIVKDNDYGLTVGKEFQFARFKEGDASPFPIEIKDTKDYRIYQMKTEEAELTEVTRDVLQMAID